MEQVSIKIKTAMRKWGNDAEIARVTEASSYTGEKHVSPRITVIWTWSSRPESWKSTCSLGRRELVSTKLGRWLVETSNKMQYPYVVRTV